MMILVFEKFRKLGIGRKLFEFLEENIKKNKEKENVEYIALYVQESNIPAIKFYEKMDFKKIKIIEGYYNNLETSSAWFMRKMI